MLKDIVQNYKTDKFTSHAYLNVYEDILTPRKNSAKNILEVGIQYGGSMLLWNDYFTQAHIYGADIIPLPKDFKLTDRMTHYMGNAYNLKFIEDNFTNKGLTFDVLIDDGPHTLESMLFFAEYYSPLLTPTGGLIIEDIPVFQWTSSIIKAFPKELQTKAVVVDNRHINNRWDDILVVLDLS